LTAHASFRGFAHSSAPAILGAVIVSLSWIEGKTDLSTPARCIAR